MIFWSLQNNDTVLFPKESWNEFHAEDTKDSVSTLIVHVSRVAGFGRDVQKRFVHYVNIITEYNNVVINVFPPTERQERTTRSTGGHVLGHQRSGLGRMASHVDGGCGRVRRFATADHRVRSRQPDTAVQLDRYTRVQGPRQSATGDHVVQGRFATVDGDRQDQHHRHRYPSDHK